MASHFAPKNTRPSGGSSAADHSRFNTSYFDQPSRRRGGRGHGVGIAIGVILAVILVASGTMGVLLYRSAMSVKDSASVIMSQASTLADCLKDGNEDSLNTTVNLIVESTDNIVTEVEGPLWSVASFVPVLGEDVRSVRTLASAASDLVNEALVPIANSVAGVGLSDILQDGAVNVGLLRTLSASVSDALPVIQEAASSISSLPEAHLPQLAEILEKVQGPISEAQGLLDQVQPILDLLPQMLGADGATRTYLIIAQNNAELRATGGLPGSWGTLSITDGVISMGDFTTILHDPGLQVQITEDEYYAIATNMDTDPAQVNCTPDFTRVGELAREYWIQKGFGAVDGVVAIDPVFLQRLLALTGGFTAPDGATVDGTNAAKVLLSDTYWKFGNDGEAQDEYFVSVASLAFDQVMGNLGNAGFADLLEVFEQSAEDGRFLAWMVNGDEQNLMVNLGCSGRLETDPSSPVLGVYMNDDTYSKISWYTTINTTIGEGVKNSDGTTTYDVVTSVTNAITPEEAAAAPLYIYGGSPDKRDNSDMISFIFFYAPAGGTISNMTVSEGGIFEDYGIAEASLSGLQVFRMRMHALSGETVAFSYQVTVSADATEPLALRTTPLAQEGLMQ